jgi:serine/threonine protein kinase
VVHPDRDPLGCNDGVSRVSFSPSLPGDDSLSPDDLASVIAACDRFEADWNAGRPRRIEDELAGVSDDPIRARLFRELVALELELTHRDGAAVDPSAFFSRFPDRADAIRQVFAGARTAVACGVATTTVPAPDRTREPEPAAWAEGYELLRELGSGGQATTYLARDRALERLVVLKRYHGVASAGRREAVLNEGRALARIRSPFVAQCHGVEARGDEIDLVVEYVPGRPLSDLTADERADIRRSARLVEQVAGGLAEVHACGLLHRDIKPGNILLGDDEKPRLVDFGLAVPVASEALHSVSGSPAYMAPEQARGQGERIDARTDVYGLGAVLYFLLIGQKPHAGETLKEVLEQARDAPIVPPRRIQPSVPRALDRICVKAMAADPQARFPSAEALRRELERYRQRRWVAPVLGAAALLLALFVPAWTFWPRPARPSPDDLAGPSAGRAATETRSDTKPASPSALRVTRFEIPLFPKLDQGHYDPKRTGLLGRTSFAAREDDDLAVRAELSEPAYSYLIAFRPDGTDELCDPDDEDTPPPKKQQPVYPPPGKSEERYRLSEGAGLYAFALVVSRAPLPAYRVWKERVGQVPWTAKLSGEPGIVWRDDGQGLEPLLADDAANTRGKGVKGRDAGAPVAKLASWLRGLTGVDAVILEAFPVEPAGR